VPSAEFEASHRLLWFALSCVVLLAPVGAWATQGAIRSNQQAPTPVAADINLTFPTLGGSVDTLRVHGTTRNGKPPGWCQKMPEA
jgi:hypothetical protein